MEIITKRITKKQREGKKTFLNTYEVSFNTSNWETTYNLINKEEVI